MNVVAAGSALSLFCIGYTLEKGYLELKCSRVSVQLEFQVALVGSIGLGSGLLLRLGALFFFGNEADFAQAGIAYGAEGFFHVVELSVFIGGDGNYLVGIGFG